MPKKKLNTILIIAVACIWGILLYKFITPLFVQTEPEYLVELPIEVPVIDVRKKDTITLNFPDRDPFLGKVVKAKMKNTKSKKSITKKISKISKTAVWPKIEYLGFVKSKKSKGPLGLLRIDGKLHRVNRKAVIANLRIEEITSSEIHIINGKEKRSFVKD